MHKEGYNTIKYLTSLPRNNAVAFLSDKQFRKLSLPTDIFNDYERCRELEYFHMKHVRNTMDYLSDTQLNNNGHAKDELFIFLYYACEV